MTVGLSERVDGLAMIVTINHSGFNLQEAATLPMPILTCLVHSGAMSHKAGGAFFDRQVLELNMSVAAISQMDTRRFI